MISVVILTYNEEVNIANSLNSVSWSDDVVVLDSHSTDSTVEIARSLGARVFMRKFDDYAAQRNFAIRSIKYKNTWLLMLDADEILSTDLREEMMQAVILADGSVTQFAMRRKDYFLGKWLRHSSGYPTWFGRLFRPEQTKVRRAINEEYHSLGITNRLEGHIEHFPFSKGVAAWVEKHNTYSDLEAANFAAYRKGFSATELMSRDPRSRRRHLKKMSYRIPCRPIVTFFYLFFVRGGFLDGRAGFIYAGLRASYEFMIDAKRREFEYHASAQQANGMQR